MKNTRIVFVQRSPVFYLIAHSMFFLSIVLVIVMYTSQSLHVTVIPPVKIETGKKQERKKRHRP